MPVFFVAEPHIANDILTITGALLDHLRRSLRMTVGEEFWVGNHRRRRYLVRIQTINSRELQGRVIEERDGPLGRHPSVIVGQALLKGDRMDWVIQKATELGVAAIVPLVTDRAIARPRHERIHAQQERWQRIALEASQQAERWDVPLIRLPERATDWFTGATGSVKLILSERACTDSLTSVPLPQGSDATIALCIGPEGGWTEEEKAAAHVAGMKPVTLGSYILRAETAALAAVAILQGRLGEIG